MKSSTNQYFIGLDHMRALAAFLVFSWHFIHANGVDKLSNNYAPKFPFGSLFNEGHVGVSLFMVLSGYLFAKILGERRIHLPKFYLNRFLRLAPLMIFVMLINAWLRWHNDLPAAWYFFSSLANGLVHPSLPNGGWSITVEFHFYLLLPILLWLRSRSQVWLVVTLCGLVAGRYLFYIEHGSIFYLSYWTIIGRLDLFILGILASANSKALNKNSLAGLALAALATCYYYFDAIGGLNGTQSDVVWVYLALIEGMFLSVLINWYDCAARKFRGRLALAIATIGKISYSMYLLHFFFVFAMAKYIHSTITDLSNFYLALFASCLSFLALVPIAWLSYQLIEKTFLRLRVNYFLKSSLV